MSGPQDDRDYDDILGEDCASGGGTVEPGEPPASCPTSVVLPACFDNPTDPAVSVECGMHVIISDPCNEGVIIDEYFVWKGIRYEAADINPVACPDPLPMESRACKTLCHNGIQYDILVHDDETPWVVLEWSDSLGNVGEGQPPAVPEGAFEPCLPSNPITADQATLGCAYGEPDPVTGIKPFLGSVVSCKKVDEDGLITYVPIMFPADGGEPVEPYLGAHEPCDQPDLEEVTRCIVGSPGETVTLYVNPITTDVVSHVLPDGTVVAGPYAGELEACPPDVLGDSCDNPIFTQECRDDIDPTTVAFCNPETGLLEYHQTIFTNGVPSPVEVIVSDIVCVPVVDPVIEGDIEYQCDEDTDTWHYTVTTFIDGVLDNTTTPVDTGVACADPQPDDIDPEFEAICNADTGLWEYVTVIYTNGVPGEPTTTTTDVPCQDAPLPTITTEDICIDGFVNIVTYSTDAAGVTTEVNAIATTVECDVRCGDPQCVKWQSVFVQLDNTGTTFKEAIEFNITNTDGTVTTFSVGPVAGWSDQVVAIAAAMDAAYDGNYDPRCTFLPNGCGGLLPPPSDAPAQPGIFARYINGTHCPTDLKIPIKATGTYASGKVVDLPFYVIKGPEYRGRICPDCCKPGEAPTLLDENFEPVPEADLPACTFSCAEQIPEPPLAVCDFDTLAGNWCDTVYSADPDEDDEIVQSEIIITVATCGSEQSISYAIVVDDALEAYEPAGTVVDCETGEAPFVEPPACPEGAVFEQVCVPGDNEFILDNSLWEDGVAPPANHLQNGNAYTIALFDAAGVEITRTGPLSDPYFNGMLNSPPPGCNVVPVCANHTSPKGCHPAHVANLDAFGWYDANTFAADPRNPLGNPDQAELWATGWGFRCAGCGDAPAYVEIVDSSNPAWIGVRKNLIVYTQPDLIAFRAITCDGVFWKDCDGNDIPAPAGGCCAKPCAADGTSPMVTVEEPACYEQSIICNATRIESRITTSPDSLDDFTAFSLSYEVGGVEIIPIDESTLPLQRTNRDYIDGRAEMLLDGAGFPYTWEVIDIVDAGGESTYTAILVICLPEDAEGGSFKLGSDWTQDSEPAVLEQTVAGNGVLCTNKDTGESVLIAGGEIVDEYTLVDCPAAPNPLEDVIGDSCCDLGEGGGDEGCAVTETTQNEHTGYSVFQQNGAPALKVAGLNAAMVEAVNAAIAADCIFMLKHGDGATFIGNGATSTLPADGSGAVIAPGLATATACDGTELASVDGSQPAPSTLTLITYCGKVEEAGDPRQVLFTEDKCAADALGDILEAINCNKTECADPCENGSTYIFGRPPAGQPWTWGPYSGDNLVEFEAALTAAGYTVTASPPGPNNEKHQICPPFGAFGEDPNALVINSVGESTATVEPNIDPDFVATPTCADRTVGCNDDRRDAKLDAILEALSKRDIQIIETCAGELVGYYTDDGTVAWGPIAGPDAPVVEVGGK